MSHKKLLTIILPLLFVSLPHLCFAESTLTYVPSKELVREIQLENDVVRYTLAVDRAVRLVSIEDKTTGTDYLAGNQPLMFSSVRMPWTFLDVGYDLFTYEDAGASVTITQQSSYVENPLVVSQTFSLDEGNELQWCAKVRSLAVAGWSNRDAQVIPASIRFPVMQDLKVGENQHYLIPTQGSNYCIDSPDDFIFYFTNPYDPKMPIDIYADNDRGVYFHFVKAAFDLSFANKDDFIGRTYSVNINPEEEIEIVECRISPHTGDWHAAFDAFKQHIRSDFDFSLYERPIQKTYRQRLVSHFTFLYGHDIYDPAKNIFEIDRFLDEGELNFGGYDYMLLWHDYPRMGIDDRDQFAMYEDLSGGLDGLKKMVDRAHKRDVQVFLPYKPWDIMRSVDDHFVNEARVAKAINSDGVFLDTMSASDDSFRKALDNVNPDNVFVSEGRPSIKGAEIVTGSWNQSGEATNKMPNIDLFRFVLPEHNVHNINRNARKRDELVYNALFNGVGFIVWEDIFGEINRYSWNERILIRRYSRIIHENSDAYLTSNPVPLVKTLRNDLYVNAFPTEEKCVYPMFQNDRAYVSRMDPLRLIGPFMPVEHPDNWHFVDVWNHQEIGTEILNGKTYLVSPEEPADMMSCIVGMPVNLTAKMTENSLDISVIDPIENGSILINTVNNLSMMEEEVLKIGGNGGKVKISKLNLDFPYLVIIKLMQGDIMKDEIILNLGWKKF